MNTKTIKNKDMILGNEQTYFLFAFHEYYPYGGVDDLIFKGSFENCKLAFENNQEEFYKAHITNENLEIVLYGLNRADIGCLWEKSSEELTKSYVKRLNDLYPSKRKEALKPLDLSKVKFYDTEEEFLKG